MQKSKSFENFKIQYQNALHGRQYDIALNLLKKMSFIANRGQRHFVWNGKGNVYRTKGDFKQAIKCYQKAIKISPRLGAYWSNLSVAFAGEKEWGKALKAASVALKKLKKEKIFHKKLLIQLKKEILDYKKMASKH